MEQKEKDDVLVDITNINLDITLPIEERLKKYVYLINDPYNFMVGDTVVHVKHNNQGKPLDDLLTEHFIRRKRDD